MNNWLIKSFLQMTKHARTLTELKSHDIYAHNSYGLPILVLYSFAVPPSATGFVDQLAGKLDLQGAWWLLERTIAAK
jgi:hypothetical protein